MKNRHIIRIFGIIMVLALLVALIPAAAVIAATPTTNTFSLTPVAAKVNDTITVSGAFVPGTSEYWINLYLSPTAVTPNITTLITTIATYHLVGGAVLQTTTENSEGTWATTFAIPSTMTTGPTDANVTSGTYYIYATKTPVSGTETGIYARATLTITAPALDPLSPASGPAGTEVSITGSSFTANTALVFKLDGTTILTPKTGTDTVVRSTGIFISTVTIPAATASGSHTINVYLGASTTVVATATFTVTASASLSPLVPVTGPPGTDVTITGANFPANATIVFQLDTTTLTPKAGSLMTGSNGSFMSILTVPASFANGAYLFTITASGTSLTASFTVAGAATTTTTTTTPTSTTTTTTTTTPTSTTTTPVNTSKILFTGGSHAAGSTISLVAMGFTPGLDIIFTFDSVLMGKVAASSDGVGAISYTIPAGKSGAHIISANDGIKSATLDFPIESVAPPIPQPKSPGMNANVKSPVTFGWAAVTDDSLPVTYNLQISSDMNFTAGTILIDKTRLTAVEYTLTNEELLKLSSAKTNYYWREKSVDAALNESEWAPAIAFTVTQPFKFTGWPMYVTFGVAGVLLFLLGLWLGRRTAFSY